MEDTLIKIYDIINSEIFKYMLFSLISVAKTKTSKNYAWTTVKNSLIELKVNYSFLGYISIRETNHLHYTIYDIFVTSGFDEIDTKQIGQAIQSIIDL